MPRKQKNGRESLHPTLDVVRRQPINDIIPYFSFPETTSVSNSNGKEESFYAGFCLPESSLIDRKNDVFSFTFQDRIIYVQAGSVVFTDYEGVKWPTN